MNAHVAQERNLEIGMAMFNNNNGSGFSGWLRRFAVIRTQGCFLLLFRPLVFHPPLGPPSCRDLIVCVVFFCFVVVSVKGVERLDPETRQFSDLPKWIDDNVSRLRCESF